MFKRALLGLYWLILCRSVTKPSIRLKHTCWSNLHEQAEPGFVCTGPTGLAPSMHGTRGIEECLPENTRVSAPTASKVSAGGFGSKMVYIWTAPDALPRFCILQNLLEGHTSDNRHIQYITVYICIHNFDSHLNSQGEWIGWAHCSRGVPSSATSLGLLPVLATVEAPSLSLWSVDLL